MLAVGNVVMRNSADRRPSPTAVLPGRPANPEQSRISPPGRTFTRVCGQTRLPYGAVVPAGQKSVTIRKLATPSVLTGYRSNACMGVKAATNVTRSVLLSPGLIAH